MAFAPCDPTLTACLAALQVVIIAGRCSATLGMLGFRSQFQSEEHEHEHQQQHQQQQRDIRDATTDLDKKNRFLGSRTQYMYLLLTADHDAGG